MLLTSEERIIVKETLLVENDIVLINCFKTDGCLWRSLGDFTV